MTNESSISIKLNLILILIMNLTLYSESYVHTIKYKKNINPYSRLFIAKENRYKFSGFLTFDKDETFEALLFKYGHKYRTLDNVFINNEILLCSKISLPNGILSYSDCINSYVKSNLKNEPYLKLAFLTRTYGDFIECMDLINKSYFKENVNFFGFIIQEYSIDILSLNSLDYYYFHLKKETFDRINFHRNFNGFIHNHLKSYGIINLTYNSIKYTDIGYKSNIENESNKYKIYINYDMKDILKDYYGFYVYITMFFGVITVFFFFYLIYYNCKNDINRFNNPLSSIIGREICFMIVAWILIYLYLIQYGEINDYPIVYYVKVLNFFIVIIPQILKLAFTIYTLWICMVSISFIRIFIILP